MVHLADQLGAFPADRIGAPPVDRHVGDAGVGRERPAEPGVRAHRAAQLDCRRRGGRQRQGLQGGCQRAAQLGGIGRVEVRQVVAVLAPVLDARRLVLAVVVLDHLRQTDRGKSLLVERGVIGAARDAVAAQHHQQVEVLHVPLAESFQVARPLARRAVVLAADGVAQPLLRLGLRDGRPLRVEAAPRIVHHPVLPLDVAGDVHAGHRQHLHALLLEAPGEVGRSDQPLLLACHGHEVQGDRGLLPGEGARQLQRHRRAARVVHRARRVALRVHHVGRHAVVVARHHDGLLRSRRVGPGQHRAHVDQLYGSGNAAARLGGEPILEGLEPRALCGCRELRRQPAPGGADAARLRPGVGQRVPRAEPDQLRHGGLQRRGLDALHHCLHARIPAGGRDRGQQQDEQHRFPLHGEVSFRPRERGRAPCSGTGRCSSASPAPDLRARRRRPRIHPGRRPRGPCR